MNLVPSGTPPEILVIIPIKPFIFSVWTSPGRRHVETGTSVQGIYEHESVGVTQAKKTTFIKTSDSSPSQPPKTLEDKFCNYIHTPSFRDLRVIKGPDLEIWENWRAKNNQRMTPEKKRFCVFLKIQIGGIMTPDIVIRKPKSRQFIALIPIIFKIRVRKTTTVKTKRLQRVSSIRQSQLRPLPEWSTNGLSVW